MTVLHTFFRTNSCKNSRYSVFRKKKSYVLEAYFFFLMDLLHARLNSQYKARVTRKTSTKKLKHTGNRFRKNLQLIGVC